MGKNNRWNRGSANAAGWKLAKGRWTQEPPPKPTNSDEKNWRCFECGNTDNPGWSTWCWRATCQKDRPPPAEPKPPTPAPTAAVAATEKDPEPSLADARRLLNLLKNNCGSNHSFVTEQAAVVHKLEEAQRESVTATERLQKLWASQKALEAKVKQASEAVDAAHTAADAAATKLRERLATLRDSQTDLTALKLDVAEASAALHAEQSPQAPAQATPVQAIAQLIENADQTQMLSAGLTPAILCTVLQQLTTLVALASGQASAPPPTPTPTPPPLPGIAAPPIFLNVGAAPAATAPAPLLTLIPQQQQQPDAAALAQQQQQADQAAALAQQQLEQQNAEAAALAEQQRQQQLKLQQQQIQQQQQEHLEHQQQLQLHQQQQQQLLLQHEQEEAAKLTANLAVEIPAQSSQFANDPNVDPGQTMSTNLVPADAPDEISMEDGTQGARGALRKTEELLRESSSLKAARIEEPAPVVGGGESSG